MTPLFLNEPLLRGFTLDGSFVGIATPYGALHETACQVMFDSFKGRCRLTLPEPLQSVLLAEMRRFLEINVPLELLLKKLVLKTPRSCRNIEVIAFLTI